MFGSITGFLFITKHNKHAIALKLSTITAIAFILSRYGALLIIKNKNFTSENCIYWIKTKDFKNWKLAIYNAEKEASNIQDTFANFIVERLNYRDISQAIS